jgi:hypothetical protein
MCNDGHFGPESGLRMIWIERRWCWWWWGKFFFFFLVVGQDSNSVTEEIGVQVAQVFGVHVVQAVLSGYHIS